MDNSILQNLREDYRLRAFDIDDAMADPFEQFQSWFDDALEAKILEANAMTLATASSDGIPNARIVLLKGFDAEGFTFYTNYDSAKGKELETNPHAVLVFNWLDLQRQVRISGAVQRVDNQTSSDYFALRPKSSQIGAWASPQSQIIPNRLFLETKEQMLAAQFANADALPRPAHWGGYAVKPTWIEFWQGRSSRLHDRIRYDFVDGAWQKVRLAP